MKKYENLYLEVRRLKELDVICTSGELMVGEFDNDDIFGE